MRRVIDPGLFAESLCKFHAGWLIEDTWNVVGSAVMKVTLFHSSASLTGGAELAWEKNPFPAVPTHTNGRQGAQPVKAPSGLWPAEVPPSSDEKGTDVTKCPGGSSFRAHAHTGVHTHVDACTPMWLHTTGAPPQSMHCSA